MDTITDAKAIKPMKENFESVNDGIWTQYMEDTLYKRFLMFRNRKMTQAKTFEEFIANLNSNGQATKDR